MKTRKRKMLWIGGGLAVVLLGLVGVLLSGGSGGKGPLTVQGYTLPRKLPAYALQDDYTQASYMVAVAMPEALRTIPCYCSCDAVGHRDLADCFLKGRGFTSHAAGCGICKVEAVRTAEMLLEGMSLREARAAIDQGFKGRYGRPTPTPLPETGLYLDDLAPELDREAFRRALNGLTD